MYGDCLVNHQIANSKQERITVRLGTESTGSHAQVHSATLSPRPLAGR